MSGIREMFWKRTAASLLAQRDLRLISVWHPSFLGLDLGYDPREWDDILLENVR
jgi:hypothetical protein